MGIEMKKFGEAQRLIQKYSTRLPAHETFVSDALGCVLADNLRACVDLPGFDNSAMDGFALKSWDTRGAMNEKPVKFLVQTVIQAGSKKRVTLLSGHACRIMTGAPIPEGADTVLEKEKAVLENGVLVMSSPMQKGRHVRCRGEEMRKNASLNLKGTVVTPGVVGFLSSLGISRVRVYRKPRISIITTGDELVHAGRPLQPGQIYDSNTPMLVSALERMRIRPLLTRRGRDADAMLRRILIQTLSKSDMIILTGGVSAGDYDFVRNALKDLEVREIFWKVSQKPGKPLFFGRKKDALVFGLPGNPAAVFTCFYEYVYPSIRLRMGYERPFLLEKVLPVKKSLTPDPQKTFFLKGCIDKSIKKEKCIVLGFQGSHMLSSFCRANGFVVVPPGKKKIQTGEQVKFHFLPEMSEL